MTLRPLILSLLAIPAPVWAGGPDSLLTALAIERQGLWQMAAPVYDNPALSQWRMSAGLTTVDVTYGRHSDNVAVDPQAGDGAYSFSGGALTYTKYRSSTLSGTARYTNGKRHGVRWCETSDPEIVYPYLTADSIGGDINSESYSFSGGYADRRGRLQWGANLSYKALLEYRGVDPRPRNVSGTLDAAVAVGLHFNTGYTAALAADFRRYTQSNDIEFKSEMGVDKIFHLTGPVRHYARFAGTGLSAHYRGYRYGAGAALCPTSGRGFFASVHASHFAFDKLLSDLNRLPMASATHRSIEATTGYLHPGRTLFWALSASATSYRRHGRENIFGDATAGMYPQIASVDMFAANATTASMSVLGGWYYGPGSALSLRLTPTYSYSSWLYLSPRSVRRNRAIEPLAQLQWHGRPAHRWLLTASAYFSGRLPFACLYAPGTTDTELRQLAEIEQHQSDLESARSYRTGISLGAACMLSRRLGLDIRAGFDRSGYTASIHSNSFDITTGLIF